jgi:GTP-binding protein Era
MQQSVLDSLSESDVVLFMMDASQDIQGVGRGDRYVASLVAGSGTPAVAVINKADLLSSESAELPIVKEVLSLAGWEEVFLLSVTEGLNIEPLMDAVASLLPEGPEYFPKGVVTDYPESGILAEYVREKALEALREEVPHAVAVEIEDVESEGGLTTVAATIYVERPTQRMIVLGKGGRTIKRIGTEARGEVERLLGGRIYLDLKVKVRPGWRKDERFLERMGL